MKYTKQNDAKPGGDSPLRYEKRGAGGKMTLTRQRCQVRALLCAGFPAAVGMLATSYRYKRYHLMVVVVFALSMECM